VTRDADIEVLHRVAMLRPLPEPTIEYLASGLERAVYTAGATVFDEGDPGASFYVVTGGRAEVTRGGSPVAKLGPGECFGEIALLRSDLPRTATVRAARDAALRVQRRTRRGPRRRAATPLCQIDLRRLTTTARRTAGPAASLPRRRTSISDVAHGSRRLRALPGHDLVEMRVSSPLSGCERPS
jgi:CRP-like cAMP-binding protein